MPDDGAPTHVGTTTESIGDHMTTEECCDRSDNTTASETADDSETKVLRNATLDNKTRDHKQASNRGESNRRRLRQQQDTTACAEPQTCRKA